MEKEEKTIVEQAVEETTDVKDVVVENTENKEEEENMENVDDNTAIDSENATIDPVVPPVTDDTVDNAVEPVVPPVEDVTLAPTDDVIAAPEVPVDAPVDVPAMDAPVEAPAEIPAEPAPVVSDVVPGMGDETPADGCCAEVPCCGDEPCAPVAEQPTMTIGNFFGTIQECVTIAWRFHLKTRIYRFHTALNDFYQGALYRVDNIIEQYQGICGIVDEPFVNCIVGDGKTEGEYFTELKAFVENNKCILGEHSEINSVIDEFLGLIDSTLYKLTSFTEHAVKTFDEFVYEDYVKESCCGDKNIEDEEEFENQEEE